MVEEKQVLARRPPPASPQAWLAELATAYADAAEALPFVALKGGPLSELELFHLAPLVCLERRGIEATPQLVRKATEAALAGHAAAAETNPELLSRPEVAFAFAYVAAHLGLDLLTEHEAAPVMGFLVEQLDELGRLPPS